MQCINVIHLYSYFVFIFLRRIQEYLTNTTSRNSRNKAEKATKSAEIEDLK